MKREFEEYLVAIQVPNALKARIETILEYIGAICDEEMVEIFVTDYMKEDGTREYENLLFFSNTFVIESKRFVTDDDLDIALLKDGVYYFSVKTQSYNFQKATEQSRIYMKVMLTSGQPDLGLDLKGSKENCDYAMRLFQRSIKPLVR
jgi:hypothetical protein